MALDGQFQIGIEDHRHASRMRWSITNFWYTRDYGYVRAQSANGNAGKDLPLLQLPELRSDSDSWRFKTASRS